MKFLPQDHITHHSLHEPFETGRDNRESRDPPLIPEARFFYPSLHEPYCATAANTYCLAGLEIWVYLRY